MAGDPSRIQSRAMEGSGSSACGHLWSLRTPIVDFDQRMKPIEFRIDEASV